MTHQNLEHLTAAHGLTTAVRTGEGRDLVILHSLLTDRQAFDPVLPELANSFRVTLFNLPGFHGSQAVPGLIDAYVARIEDGFEEFKIQPGAVLIGNGFGGTVALAFALAHQERLGALVISDAAASFPEEGKQPFRVMSEKVKAGGLAAIVDIAAKRVFSPAYLATSPEAVEERRSVLLEIDPTAFCAACDALVGADLVPSLPRLTVPTMVICGEFDQATPPELNKQIADKVEGARYVELPGCGHCPPLEQPQAFLAAIRDFIGMK